MRSILSDPEVLLSILTVMVAATVFVFVMYWW